MKVGILNEKNTDIDDGLSVDRVFRHRDFRHRGPYPNDIALLRLTSPLEWTRVVQPISLSREDPIVGSRCTILGWGMYITVAI